MFIAALFTVPEAWKQLKCPSVDESIKKIHTMEYYSSQKKEEILLFVMTWMNLNGIMLSEISQTEKEKYYMVSFIYEIFKKADYRNREKNNRMVDTRGWEEGKMK